MISCTITSSKETKKYNNIVSIIMPTFSGQIQVLPGHAESFVLLKNGVVRLEFPEGNSNSLRISQGECYIKDDNVVIVL